MVFLNAPKEHHGASANMGIGPKSAFGAEPQNGVPAYVRALQCRRDPALYVRPQSWMQRLVRA